MAPTTADFVRKSRRVSTAFEFVDEKEKAVAVPTIRNVPRRRAGAKRMVLRWFSLIVVWLRP